MHPRTGFKLTKNLQDVPIPRLKGRTKKALYKFVDDIFATVIKFRLYEPIWIDYLKERVKLVNRFYNQ